MEVTAVVVNNVQVATGDVRISIEFDSLPTLALPDHFGAGFTRHELVVKALTTAKQALIIAGYADLELWRLPERGEPERLRPPD